VGLLRHPSVHSRSDPTGNASHQVSQSENKEKETKGGEEGRTVDSARARFPGKQQVRADQIPVILSTF
jgi:hypothetical protein